jgi:hypothetical protein
MPDGSQTTGERKLTEVVRGIGAALCECAERNQAGIARHTRQDESVDGLAHRSGEEFDEAVGVAAVCALEPPQGRGVVGFQKPDLAEHLVELEACGRPPKRSRRTATGACERRMRGKAGEAPGTSGSASCSGS